MLISELKKELIKYNNKELTLIICELYKRLPKSKKEDYNIDDFIKNVSAENKPIKKEVPFEDLQKEIVYFLSCVDNRLYTIPNKIISKKERSSWRFKVKRFYKELNNILPDTELGWTSTFLLIELFKRLSTGSSTLLFVNWDTFKALGVMQSDYYDVLVKRIFSNGYTIENIKMCIDLLDVNKDYNELSISMFDTFLYNLKTLDIKELSLNYLKEKVLKFKAKIAEAKDYNRKYYLSEDLNNYVICILKINLLISEYDKGIKYFKENYISDNEEVQEYILLEILEDLNLKNEWIKEYENVKDKINLRKYLVDKYKELVESIEK